MARVFFRAASIGAASMAIMAFACPAIAQSVKASDEDNKLENTIRTDIQSALTAFDNGDYRDARLYLSAASDKTSRLELTRITQAVAAAADTFTVADASQFTLTGSSTLNFERFLEDRETAQQIFKDAKGNIVKVRVFGEEDDLKDFKFIADDDAMLAKGEIELAEMRGEPALKKRTGDGGLSVLMMSEEDHALIEIEGDSEEAVMRLIEQLESKQTQ